MTSVILWKSAETHWDHWAGAEAAVKGLGARSFLAGSVFGDHSSWVGLEVADRVKQAWDWHLLNPLPHVNLGKA